MTLYQHEINSQLAQAKYRALRQEAESVRSLKRLPARKRDRASVRELLRRLGGLVASLVPVSQSAGQSNSPRERLRAHNERFQPAVRDRDHETATQETNSR